MLFVMLTGGCASRESLGPPIWAASYSGLAVEKGGPIKPQDVQVQEGPFEEVAQYRLRPTAQTLGTSYFTAKYLSVHPADSRSSLREQAATVGATHVVWARRQISAGTPVTVAPYTPPAWQPEQPSAYAANSMTTGGNGYYQTNTTITPQYSGSTSFSNSMLQGMAAGQAAAAQRAAIYQSMPEYEFVAVFLK